LSPKTVSAYTEFSRQLLLQSSPAVDRFLTRILLSAVGVAIDVSVLNGSGASGQPLGIIGTPGIGSVTGTTLALAGVHEFQTDIGDALTATCGYATTRAVAKVLAERERLTGSGVSLWEGNLYEGTLGGYRAMSSGNIPTDHLVFGDWPKILLASWGTLAIEVNPFAQFQNAILGMRCIHSLDVGVLRPAAFSVATAVT
jgi:HK97 family phage major capsid protein